MPLGAASVYWAHTTTLGQTLTGVNEAETLRDSLGGSPTLIGGDGDTTFSVLSATTTVVAQAGYINTVISYHGFALPANVQNLTLAGDHITGVGNSLNNLIIAQGLNDSVDGGTGDDVLVDAGAGQSLFTFDQGVGHDVLYGFKEAGTSADLIALTDPTITSFAQLQADMTQQGADTLLTLSGGSEILLKGITASTLTASDFRLAAQAAYPSAYSNFSGQAMPLSAPSQYWANTTVAGQSLTGVNEPETLRDSLGGSPTLIGGSADTVFNIISPTTNIEAQAGHINSVIAYRGYAMQANIQNLTVIDDHSTGVGNSLNDLIIADGLNDSIVAGGGSDVLVDAGAGQSVFTFNPGFGQDVIYGFKPTGTDADKIVLTDPTITSFAEVQANMTQQGSDTLITLSGGSEILLKAVTATSLTASDFGLHLNLSGMTETFDGEFASLSLYNPATGTGTWKTNFAFGIQSGAGDWESRTEVGNHELQLYVDPNYAGTGTKPLGLNPFSVSNGVLDIHAGLAPTADVSALSGYQYTSGLLSTEKSFSQLYGYFEIKAELPNAPGAWPAFWMLPENPTSAAEIDILEDFGGSPIHQTVIHGPTSSPSQTYFVNTVPTDGTSFHTYGVLWTSKEIDFYIDGVNVGSTPTPSDVDTPMYMMMNLAVGGISGTPAPGFSADMKVAYVHAYSLASVGSSSAPAAVKAALTSQSLAAPVTTAASTSTLLTSEQATAVATTSSSSFGDNHALTELTGAADSHAMLVAHDLHLHLQDHVWA